MTAMVMTKVLVTPNNCRVPFIVGRSYWIPLPLVVMSSPLPRLLNASTHTKSNYLYITLFCRVRAVELIGR